MMMTMMMIKSFFLLFVCMASGVSGSLIRTTVQKITAVEGEDVELMCTISDASSDSVLWQNGSIVLSMNRRVYAPSTNDKFFIVGERNAFNLLLKRVTSVDEGNYSCQIPGKVTHYHVLTVNVPASVKFNPDKEKRTLIEDSEFRLECLVSGKPQPSITWNFTSRYDHRELYDIRNITALVIEEISRTDAGSYTCIADNGVGVPARRTFQVEVEFAPDVVVKSHVVHVIPGKDVTSINCWFIANPDVEVDWYHNGSKANLQSHRNMYTGHVKSDDGYDRWTLNITNFQPSQFGNYTCVGENKLGRTYDTIVITPLPVDLRLVSTPLGRYSDRYTVRWVAYSHSKLTNFEIALKQLNESFNSKWHNSSIAIVQSQIPLHTQDYTFDNLEANSSYVVIVKAKNQYGYSNWSKEFIFHTALVTQSRSAFVEPEKLLVFIIAATVMLK